MTIEFKAVECDSAHDAIQHADASGCGDAIRLGGKYYAIFKAETDRLAAAGVEFAYVCDHDGRIVTVPVND